MEYGYIYAIINTENNKLYVGSSVCFKKRIREHKRMLRKRTHHSIHLQRSYDKSPNSFVFEILCQEPKLTLRSRELEIIELLKPEFNIAKSTHCPMFGRKHSPETLLKFKGRKTCAGIKRSKWTPEQRLKILRSRLGQKRSDSFKRAQSENAKTNLQHKYLLAKIEASKRKVISSEGLCFKSLIDAATHYDISVQSVCDNLKGRSKKTRAGVKFEYL